MIPSPGRGCSVRNCLHPRRLPGLPPGLLAPYALANLKVLNRTGAGHHSMRSACCLHQSLTDGDCQAPSSTAAAPPVPGAQLFIPPAESWERQPMRYRSQSQGLYRGQPGVSTPDSPTFRWGLHERVHHSRAWRYRQANGRGLASPSRFTNGMASPTFGGCHTRQLTHSTALLASPLR